MISHLYMLRNDYHNKPSYHPSPHSYNFFILMKRTFKIYFLSFFLIRIFNKNWGVWFCICAILHRYLYSNHKEDTVTQTYRDCMFLQSCKRKHHWFMNSNSFSDINEKKKTHMLFPVVMNTWWWLTHQNITIWALGFGREEQKTEGKKNKENAQWQREEIMFNQTARLKFG